MIPRRAFLRTLAASYLSCAIQVHAHAGERVRRVGWLHLGREWSLQPFRDKLRALGWIEGENLRIEGRWADNLEIRLPVLARELVDGAVDVIVTQTTLAAMAARAATAVVPIVMAGSDKPVARGIIGSLHHPGGNVTGLTNNPGAGFIPKMIQLLKEAAPHVSRLGVLEHADEGVSQEIAAVGRELGLTTVAAEANSHKDVPAALLLALRSGANGLFAPPNAANDPARKAIVDFALAHGWPSMGGDKYFVAAGGLMSYWTDWNEIRRQAAVYVDRILRGAQPGDLPVEQPSKFELVMNLRTAAALRLTIAPSLLLRADALIA